MLSIICCCLYILMIQTIILNSAQVQTTEHGVKNMNTISEFSTWIKNNTNFGETPMFTVPSRETRVVSQWISFAEFSKFDTRSRVEERFLQLFTTSFHRVNNMYNCVLKCSSFEGTKYIVYFQPSTVLVNVKNPYDFYCQGDTGLIFFAINKRNTAPIEESLNLSVDNAPPLHCLLITKGVQSIGTIKDCNRKLKKMNFEVVDSIIFRIENIYLQWTCNNSQGNKGEIYFRVIFQNHSDAITMFTDSINTPKTTNIHVDVSLTGKITTFNQNNSMTEATAITTYDRTAQTDLCIKLIIGVAAFLGTVIVFLLVVVYILRRKLRKASYICLTVRRDQNTYNEITTHLSDADQYHEILPLSEMSASGSRPPHSPSIDRKQNVDSSGYLILSSSFQRNEKQCDST